MRVCVVRDHGDGLDRLIEAIESSSQFELVGRASTGGEISATLRADKSDVLLFSTDSGDLVRTVRRAVGIDIDAPPLMIASTVSVSTSVMVWAALFGFHGVIPGDGEPAAALEDLAAFADGRRRLLDVPEVRDLAHTPGLLARDLVVDDPRDGQIADLVGAGLTDENIAGAMELPVQIVRNRIEHVLHVNGLSYRTQLAVMRAASVTVPDFC